MSSVSIPNFFIAGAPKAGTTSLYHYLQQHPDVFMSPVKEPSYFSMEARPENFIPELQPKMKRQMEMVKERLDGRLTGNLTRGVVGSWDDYVRLFENARGERAIGEASVCYLWSESAAREIAAVNPASRIVLILRHPAERAFSQYLHYLSDGHIAHSFSDHVAKSLRSGTVMSPFHPFLEFGMYSEQLQRYYAHFPAEQIRVWLYEETTASPAKFYREVLEFLGVDAGFVPDTSRRHYQMEIPKALPITQKLRRSGVWGVLRDVTPRFLRPAVKRLVYRKRGALRMGVEERAFLVQYYRDDVHRLEKVLERDLSAWMR